MKQIRIQVENDGGELYATFPEGHKIYEYFYGDFIPADPKVKETEGYSKGWDDAMQYIRDKTYE